MDREIEVIRYSYFVVLQKSLGNTIDSHMSNGGGEGRGVGGLGKNRYGNYKESSSIVWPCHGNSGPEAG